MARTRVLADLTPLRESRDYRFLFSGQVASYIGRQFTVVAIPIQVYAMTHSSLMVGLVGLASLGPLIVFSLAGGALSDAFDRRRLLQEVAGTKVEPSREPLRPGELQASAVDVTRIAEELDWRPEIDLAKGLGETFAWYRKQR